MNVHVYFFFIFTERKSKISLFFLGDVFELVKSIFHVAETDVSIEEIIAPCDQPCLLDLPIINRCELILLFFSFLWLQTHIIFVIFVTTLEEKSTSCNFYISLLDVRFPLFFGQRLHNYFLEICSS